MARSAIITGAILLPCTVLLAACSAGAANGPSSAAGTRALSHAAESVPAPAGQEQLGPDSGTFGSSSSTQAEQTAKLAQLSQSIIYTANLTLRPRDVMVTAKTAIRLVTAAGGYVAGEQAVAGSGKSGGMVTLTLKVPVPNYQGVLTALSGLGKQLALTQQATDVTQEVANVNSLVSSEQAAITALQGLLKRAATVSELLQVQQQISGDESSLESLLAQQRALSHETTYATISMTLLSTHHPVRHKQGKAKHGFVAGLSAGWRALKHATVAVLTALGAALPFLVVLVILAGAGLLVRRRVRAGRADSPEAS